MDKLEIWESVKNYIAVGLIILIVILLCSSCAHIDISPRPWTKDEKMLGAIYIGLHGANAYTTERHQDSPDRYHEVNPALGKHPSDRDIAVYFSVTGIIGLTAAHFMPKYRKAILIGYSGLNAYWALHDYQVMK
jgi:hypothetical protein